LDRNLPLPYESAEERGLSDLRSAVVALTEILQRQLVGSPVGVALLCPWWVQAHIFVDHSQPGDNHS
jgi:hypothetical protein